MKTSLACLTLLGAVTSFAILSGTGKLTGGANEISTLKRYNTALAYEGVAAKARPGVIAPGETEKAATTGGPVVPATPFEYQGDRVNKQRAEECLAAAAWYEAGDDAIGQRAVIQTVLNRVRNRSFPNSVCGVVFEGSQLPTGCQFTFTCDGSLDRRRPSAVARNRALKLAEQAMSGFVDESVGDATHYHADYVTPWWSAKLERLSAVGPHIFYRWRASGNARPGRVGLATEADYDDLVAQAKRAKAVERLETAVVGSEKTEVAGIDDVRRNTVQLASRNPNVFYISVGNSEASGRWALTAMNRCENREDCQVIGYTNSEAVERNLSRATPEKDRPLFMFVRRGVSGMDVALWDCERVKRPQANQCLPVGEQALMKLMRNMS
ncbi:MAG: cell wall hydrolase [Novosphingobium sp.]|nr:cell wall hydrolase [Novosphingobium sp.]